MNRDYTTGSANDITLFVGTEIEHTAAYGLKTLFVVGVQDPTVIIETAAAHDCDHIYMGANMSFSPTSANIDEGWTEQIQAVLDAGYWITLDFQPTLFTASYLRKTKFTQHDRFIPVLSVRIPHIEELGNRAHIKLDDIDYNTTNPGVWVHSLNDLKDGTKFTGWDEYANDDPL